MPRARRHHLIRRVACEQALAQHYADEPDYGRCLVLCLRYCIDACENVHAMRWLGFMHQIGRFVGHDAHEAARLYRMAEMRGDCQRQAAFRLAELVIDEANEEWSIPYDPVLALHYYQVAEIGMRIDMVSDSPWYAERLEQAIGGQERARTIMDEMGVDLAKRGRLLLT